MGSTVSRFTPKKFSFYNNRKLLTVSRGTSQIFNRYPSKPLPRPIDTLIRQNLLHNFRREIKNNGMLKNVNQIYEIQTNLKV